MAEELFDEEEMKAFAEKAMARKLERVNKKIKRQELKLAQHQFKVQVAAQLEDKSIDLNSLQAKIALSRVQAQDAIRNGKEIEVSDIKSERFSDTADISSNDKTPLHAALNEEYRSGMNKPMDPVFALVKKEETPPPILSLYGLSQLQVTLLTILTHPKDCLDEYGDLSRESLAKMLKVSEDLIVQSFNQKLMEALWKESSLILRLNKTAVDDALLESARTPGPKGAADRKLYYSLIGALKEGSAIIDDKKMSREKKQEIIQQTLAKLTAKKVEFGG